MQFFPWSAYQSALILILIVEIPFLIVLIVAHFLPGRMWPTSEHCNVLCDLSIKHPLFFVPLREIESVTSEEPTALLRFHKRNLSHALMKPKRSIYEQTSKALIYPSIGALIQDSAYMCPIALISVNWALATCLNNKENASNLFVRLGANSWSSGGVLKPVNKVIFNQDQVAVVNFDAPLATEAYILPLNMPKTLVHKANVPQIPLFMDSELILAEVVQLPSRFCMAQSGKVAQMCVRQQVVSCDEAVDAPLVSGIDLVGMYRFSKCENEDIVYFRDGFGLYQWLNQLNIVY